MWGHRKLTAEQNRYRYMPKPSAHHPLPFSEFPNSTKKAIAEKISATSETLCLKIFRLSVGHSLLEELSPDIRHGFEDFPFAFAEQIGLPANDRTIEEEEHEQIERRAEKIE